MRRLVTPLRPKFILMIGDDGLLLIPYNVSGETEPLFATERNQPSVSVILDILKRHPRVPLILFADNLAQDFRRETIPRLNLLDRPKLIERRLQQAFPHAGLTQSINCKSDRTQILLTGLHRDTPVFEWIDRLKEQCPDNWPRIALLAVECADMCVRLLPDAINGWALLLSRQRTGGFRQIVTHKSELIFTRLTPPLPSSASAGELAEAVARDIKASLGYLGRLGLSDPAELHVALLLPESAHMALRLLSLPVHSLRLLAPYQAAWEIDPSLKLEKSESYSDLLYARWLVNQRKLKLSLAPPDLKKKQRDAIVRLWGWRIAAVAIFIAFITTALQAGDFVSIFLKARQETIQLKTLKEKFAEERATAAPITEPLGRLREAIERRRVFSEPTASPWAMLQMLNAGLGNEARLARFNWQSESDKPSDEVMQAEVRFAHTAISSVADRDTIVARFKNLAHTIILAMPGYDVRLTRYPFPALPEEALSNEGVAGNITRTVDTAELTVQKKVP